MMSQQEREELQEETVRICQELIRFPSVNFGDGKGDEKDIANYVVASLAAMRLCACSSR